MSQTLVRKELPSNVQAYGTRRGDIQRLPMKHRPLAMLDAIGLHACHCGEWYRGSDPTWPHCSNCSPDGPPKADVVIWPSDRTGR